VALAGELGLPAAVDPKQHLDAFVGVRLVKPNLAEAEALVGEWAHSAHPGLLPGARERIASARREGDGAAIDPIARAHGLARSLANRLPGADVALTLGAGGMVICESGAAPITVPTARLDVYDVQGAGDTSFAALWLARLAGASAVEAARIANAASGVAVSKVGTAIATRDEVRARLPSVVAAAG
jgi:D-beta-D-heptose 7-phosphate kinase/D-beta-D-heptose 1-phosphate adenosyltransferase